MVLSFFLMSGVAFAGTPKDGDPQQAPAAKTKKPAKPPVKSATALLAEQVEALRKLWKRSKNSSSNCRKSWPSATPRLAMPSPRPQPQMPKLSPATATASAAASSTAEVKTTTTALSSDVADLKLGSDAVKAAVTDTQKKIVAGESPSTIHYKGITITPGGFLAAETVFRTRAASADINTTFHWYSICR